MFVMLFSYKRDKNHPVSPTHISEDLSDKQQAGISSYVYKQNYKCIITLNCYNLVTLVSILFN